MHWYVHVHFTVRQLIKIIFNKSKTTNNTNELVGHSRPLDTK